MKKGIYLRFCLILILTFLSVPAWGQFQSNPLSQALDNTQFDFFTESPAFFSQRNETNFDGDAAQSGAIGNDGVTVLATGVIFPTEIVVTFDWRVSSERGFDFLVFTVLDLNGNPRNIVDSISGETDWATRSLRIPAGQHFLVWGYLKDGSVSAGRDAGWIDNIRIGGTGGESANGTAEAPVVASIVPILNLLLSDDAPVEPVEPSLPIDAANLFPPIAPLTEAGPHLIIESEEGDFIGKGLRYEYTQLNANFTVSTNIDNGFIGIRLEGYSGAEPDVRDNWTLSLSGGGERLAVGRYLNASRHPFNGSNENGLDFSGNGSGCNSLSGEFTIYEIEYAGEDLVKLTADFVQFCGSSNSALRGSIRFDASLPDAVFPGIPAATGQPTPELPNFEGNGTVIEIEGANSDPITRGEDLSFSDANSTIIPRLTNNNRGISFTIRDEAGRFYSLDMIAERLDISNQRPLSTGVYNNALRAAFSSPQPGLSFTGNGSGCNTSLGTFSIYEIEFDTSNIITRLLADFEQMCGSGNEPLRGSIRYVNKPSQDIPNTEPLDEVNLFPPIAPLTEAGPHLVLESAPGDFIGQGLNYSYTQLNANFTVSSNFQNGVSVQLNGYSGVTPGRSENWTLNLSGGGEPLAVGRYQNASRFPFNDSAENGLSFSGSGRGCNSLSGEFNIYEITYSEGEVVKLTADFVQRCENRLTPLRGSIRFDASLPDAIFPGILPVSGTPTPELPILSGSGTVIEIEGSGGDFITGGSDFSFNDQNSTITAQTNNSNFGIRFSIRTDDGDFYTLEFRPSQLSINNQDGGRLTTGVHLNALRAPFSSPQPGLSFSGGGRGCNTSFGRFSVYQISYNALDEITHLLADFEVGCGSGTNPLRGSINYVR